VNRHARQLAASASPLASSFAPPVPARRRALLLLEDLGGGTGNHVCRLASRWHALGWHVVVVTQRPPVVGQLPQGVDIRVVRNAGWYDRFPLAQARRLVALWRLVRTFNPDVVHTYFFWSIIYGRILKAIGAIPLLVENREDLGFSWGRGAYLALRLTRKIPDRVICVAEAVRQVAIQREAADPSRAIVIHNGVEALSDRGLSREAARARFGIAPEHVVIGMVANLPRAVKGGVRMLDAVKAIVADAPNARFLLVGVGTEASSLAPELQARGISDVVIGLGYRPDVESCYAAMDVSVLTSTSEGLSMTLLESMRQRLPTVVTHVGGNPELVVDGVTGFLVPVHDMTAFAQRVVELVRDEELRRAMGVAGHCRVAERFALAEVAHRYLDVYTELRDGAPRCPRREDYQLRESLGS
jgi:glycosyltransferase involved in cell wall biosynthesis